MEGKKKDPRAVLALLKRNKKITPAIEKKITRQEEKENIEEETIEETTEEIEEPTEETTEEIEEIEEEPSEETEEIEEIENIEEEPTEEIEEIEEEPTEELEEEEEEEIEEIDNEDEVEDELKDQERDLKKEIKKQKVKSIKDVESFIKVSDKKRKHKTTLGDLLTRDSFENLSLFKAREMLTLMIFSKIVPKVTPQTAVNIGHMFVKKMYFGISYISDIESLLKSVTIQLNE
jgi:hypothetical protein